MNDPFVIKVNKFCREKKLIGNGEQILLSLSAGKDSMAMLQCVIFMADILDLKIGVFHLNHRTRGAESDADDLLVRDCCKNYNIPFHGFSENIGPDQPAFEERARSRRYELINEIMEENHYTTAATAHTLSDQVETILMHIFTGTHIKGLAGIPLRRNRIVRPLLCVTSDEVISFLKRNDILWREDSTNSGMESSRNYIRHKIIPVIVPRFPRADNTINDIGIAAEENCRLIDELAGRAGIIFEKNESGFDVILPEAGLSYELFSWIIAKLFSGMFVFCSRERVDEAWKRFHSKAQVSILFESPDIVIEKDLRDGIQKISVMKDNNSVRYETPSGKINVTNNSVSVHNNSELIAFNARIVSLSDFKGRDKDDGNIYLSISEEDFDVEICGFKEGTRILVNGSLKKVKYLMNESACSPREKIELPFFMINNDIAAIGFSFVKRGLNRVADSFLVHDESKKILAISRKPAEDEV